MIKRIIDVVGASAAPRSSPRRSSSSLALADQARSPGPVFFRQTRLGEAMRQFTALKFRTMRSTPMTHAHREYIQSTMTRDRDA